ncbi:MAG: hypothetical protein ACK45J_05950 [Acidimicrobiaceae bacterium]
MKRRLFLAVSLLVSLFVVPLISPVPAVQANPVGVYIFNTSLASNKGLGFCAPGVTKGCIESVTVDGVSLTPVQTVQQASFQIGGGLYGGPCQFIDTSVSQCEYPYMVILPIRPRTSAYLDDVVVNFRRQMVDHPTSSINAVIVNGSLQSFEPAAPGVRDVATIRAKSTEIHTASTGYCVGWVTEIDTCAIGEVGVQKSTNRLSMLLLPAMRSSVVPPDRVDDTCKQIDPTNKCYINLFDEKSRGGWVDTDASVFGLTSTDRFTGAAQLKIAGPHHKVPVNGVSELNQSYFRMFLPAAYLDASFGLTPTRANATSLPVKRTVGSGSTVPVTEYIPSAGGLLVASTGIGFSIPTMNVQRVLTVKRNQRVTATTLLKAAGVYQTLQLGKATVRINAKHGMKFSSRRYQFTKARTLVVVIRYRSTKTAVSERYLTVNVTQ